MNNPEDTEIFSSRITLPDFAKILFRRHRYFLIAALVFMAGGYFAASPVRNTWTVTCILKTPPPTAYSGTSAEEVNGVLVDAVKTSLPGDRLFAGSTPDDSSLWRQTLLVEQSDAPRTYLLHGMAYSEDGAARLAMATAVILAASHDAAMMGRKAEAAAKLKALIAMGGAARKAGGSPSGRSSIAEVTAQMAEWGRLESAQLERELAYWKETELVHCPKVNKAGAWARMVLIFFLFGFLGVFAALVIVLWREAWRGGSRALLVR